MIRTALSLLILMTIFTGIFYPGIVTLMAQLFFPLEANGSFIISASGKNTGSALIGQYFTGKNYFWGRPSATSDFPYNAFSSSASNLGVSNPELLNSIKNRIALLKKAGCPDLPVPVDLVTSSASGLDPDISPYAAFFQVQRIAKARHVPENKIVSLIQAHIKPRTLGIFGEPRVNVLELNLALDKLELISKPFFRVNTALLPLLRCSLTDMSTPLLATSTPCLNAKLLVLKRVLV